ncbi:uncharacterized protein V1518DRAFT_410312 [Limtongia smithiae]|uniref:uncharacterized protein n=1 Tax=Limtongia smithiae TaxID=1125753 RepID=UPI0034CE23ED
MSQGPQLPSQRASPSADVATSPSAVAPASRIGTVFKWAKGLKAASAITDYAAMSAPANASSSSVLVSLVAPRQAAGASVNRELLRLKNTTASLQDRGDAASRLAGALRLSQVPLSVVKIWYAAADLLSPGNPAAVRHAAWDLLIACILYDASGDSPSLNSEVYYRAILFSGATNGDDFDHQLRALKALTKDAREMPGMEILDSELSRRLHLWLELASDGVKAAREVVSNSSEISATDTAQELLRTKDRQFTALCDYIVDFIKFNRFAFDEKRIVDYFNIILDTCKGRDGAALVCNVLIALISYGGLPLPVLSPSIPFVCCTYASFDDLADTCNDIMSRLASGHLGNPMVQNLHSILSSSGPTTSINCLRGAVYFLRKLLIDSNHPDRSYVLTTPSIMVSYIAVMTLRDNPSLDLAVCQSLAAILLTEESYATISREDYLPSESPLDAITLCARRVITPQVDLDAGDVVYIGLISKELREIIAKLYTSYRDKSFTGPPGELIRLLLKLEALIDDDTASAVIDYYEQERLCHPTNDFWRSNSDALLKCFFQNQSRPYALRLRVLKHMEAVYWMADTYDRPKIYYNLSALFNTIGEEGNMEMLQHIVNLGVSVERLIGIPSFNKLIDTFMACILTEAQTTAALRTSVSSGQIESPIPRQQDALETIVTKASLSRRSSLIKANRKSTTSPPITPPNPPQSRPPRDKTVRASHIIAQAFVTMFISGLEHTGEKTAVVYKAMLNMARTPQLWDAYTLIIIFRLLVRIRVNSAGRVVILNPTDMEGLADSLGRHKPSMSPEEIEAAWWTCPETLEVFSKVPPQRSSYVVMICGSDTKTGLEQQFNTKEDYVYEEYVLDKERNIAYLNLSALLAIIIDIIKEGADWDVYSYVLAHIAPQASNIRLFMESRTEVQQLRALLCDQLDRNVTQNDMPSHVTKSDIQICMIRSMSSVLAYHAFFDRVSEDAIVVSMVKKLNGRERVAAAAIHCLLICCYEFPNSMKRVLTQVFSHMQTKITTPGYSVHVLEFLSALARIPEMTSNFTQDEFKRIFAMTFVYIEHANSMAAASSVLSAQQNILSRYLITLAHGVLSTWFLIMRMNDRHDLAPFIIERLLKSTGGGKGTRNPWEPDCGPHDEQTWALVDLITRFKYSDIPLKMYPVFSGFASDHSALKDQVVSNAWIAGLSIITIETHVKTGASHIVIRRPTGTVSFNVFPDSSMLTNWSNPLMISGSAELNFLDFSKELASSRDPRSVAETQLSFLPPYLLSQLMVSSEFQGVVNPLLIANIRELSVLRAIQYFDRAPVIENHRIGIIYMGLSQTTEREVLANTIGSKPYLEFLDGMGELVRLKDNKQIYTGGLDIQSDSDGEYAYAWSDKITQAIFHCTTLMPSRRRADAEPGSAEEYDDESLSNKKRHIGNNFVNIYWNESGHPFRFDMIPSQFNFVNIVISPHTRAASSFSSILLENSQATTLTSIAPPGFEFFKVRVLVKPDSNKFTMFSVAAHLKLIGKKSLPQFVRNLAFNADIFAYTWNNESQGEYMSNWQFRIRQIRQLADKVNQLAEQARAKHGAGSEDV